MIPTPSPSCLLWCVTLPPWSAKAMASPRYKEISPKNNVNSGQALLSLTPPKKASLHRPTRVFICPSRLEPPQISWVAACSIHIQKAVNMIASLWQPTCPSIAKGQLFNHCKHWRKLYLLGSPLKTFIFPSFDSHCHTNREGLPWTWGRKKKTCCTLDCSRMKLIFANVGEK